MEAILLLPLMASPWVVAGAIIAVRFEELVARERPDVPLNEIRAALGGPGVSDEEFLLRYIMKGEQEIEAMRRSRPKRYLDPQMPLLSLIQELAKHRAVRYVQVRRGNDSVRIQGQCHEAVDRGKVSG